jgi:RHS repeat-associated protein
VTKTAFEDIFLPYECIDTLQYGAWGEPKGGNTAGNASPFGFTGRWGGYTDVRLGWVLNGNRGYWPEEGRWGSRDKLGISGGKNLYAYVRNASVSFVDPTGFNRTMDILHCMDRKAHEFYGSTLDWSDDLGYVGLANIAQSLMQDELTDLIISIARDSEEYYKLLALATKGSMWAKMAAAQKGAEIAAKTAKLRGILASLSSALSVVAAFTTGFSLGARAGFLTDCISETSPCNRGSSP